MGPSLRGREEGEEDPVEVPRELPGPIHTDLVEVVSSLRRVGAPRVLQRLCVLVMLCWGPRWPGKHIDALETFAGRHAVTRAHQAGGLRAVGVDIEVDRSLHDFCSVAGFCHVLSLALQCVGGCQSMNAPVCSSWSWLNRGTSKRSLSEPLGTEHNEGVRLGNLMAARLVLVLLVMLAHGAWALVEQPVGSLFAQHPRMQWLIEHTRWWRMSINMGCYGAPSAKPTELYSSCQWVGELRDYVIRWWHPADTEAQLTQTSKGPRRSVSGNAATKESQHYPEAFGRAVHMVYMQHRRQLQESAARARAATLQEWPARFWLVQPGEDVWLDAGTAALERYLRTGAMEGESAPSGSSVSRSVDLRAGM